MTKVFFNQNDAYLIFTVAAILGKAGNAGTGCPMMIPIDMEEEDNDVLARQYAGTEKFRIEEGEEDLLSAEPEHLYILNIGPKPGQAADGFVQFAEEHRSEIVFWLDNHDWPAAGLSYGNRDRDMIKIHEGSVLQLLEEAGHEIPDWWKEAEAAIIAGSNYTAENEDAMRYVGALWMSLIINSNLQTDDCLLNTFNHIIGEICSGHRSQEISRLLDLMPSMMQATQDAKLHMHGDFPVFKAAKDKNRPIGYLNLGEIKTYYDLDEIMSYGVARFPWLFVLYYKLEGQLCLKVESKMFDAKKSLSYYAKSINQRLDLMRYLCAEVVNYPEPGG